MNIPTDMLGNQITPGAWVCFGPKTEYNSISFGKILKITIRKSKYSQNLEYLFQIKFKSRWANDRLGHTSSVSDTKRLIVIPESIVPENIKQVYDKL